MNEEGLKNYCRSMLRSLFEMQLTRTKAEKIGALQRMDSAADPEG